jgi:hypothetical protein
VTDVERTAAEARAAHSWGEGLRRIVTVWFALLGATGAWIVHLMALSALSPSACGHHRTRLAMHLITAGCLVVALASTGLAARLAGSPSADDQSSDRSQHRFIGLLGLLLGVTQIILIVAEELDVVALAGRHCG